MIGAGTVRLYHARIPVRAGRPALMQERTMPDPDIIVKPRDVMPSGAR